MVIQNSNTPRGPEFHGDRPNMPRDVGRNIADFPRNPEWASPFQRVESLVQLNLFDAFEVTYPVPPGFRPIQIPSPDNRVALVGPAGNATIMISAAKLPPGHPVEQIAGQPFLNYLNMGGRSPLIISIPIVTSEGTRGHMINAPLMIPGSFIGHPSIQMLPMFKYTLVLALEDHWFSFETQAWGPRLDTELEVAAQTRIHQQFRLAHKGVTLDFAFPEVS